MPALSVQSLVKSYPGAGSSLDILRGVDLNIDRGEAVAITGPSGSGKSTLLYLIGTLDQPTSGTIELEGKNPHALTGDALAKFRNERIGFVFQDHHLLPQCTLLENVLIPTLAGAGATPALEQRARELLNRVGLGERLTHLPAQLSGGERQRAAVCRALINQPLVLLADEPTGNLDRRTAEAVGGLLIDLNRELNTLLITVTHSAELAARFPRHYELQEGRLVDQSQAR